MLQGYTVSPVLVNDYDLTIWNAAEQSEHPCKARRDAAPLLRLPLEPDNVTFCRPDCAFLFVQNDDSQLGSPKALRASPPVCPSVEFELTACDIASKRSTTWL